MIRVVIDPGVSISALIGSRGAAPDLVVRAFVDDRIKVIASPLLLAELELVLRRPRFAAYVDEWTVREFVERIRRHATIVGDPVEQPAMTRDRKALTRLVRRGPRSLSHTARNTARESAAGAARTWTPPRVRDQAHVRERAFSDVSEAPPTLETDICAGEVKRVAVLAH